MASSNTAVDISELDFDEIKTKLKNYLKSQSVFTDYDFEGSALSTLLNVLAYNTHYNAYYLNMVANEMFLDTAVKRSSVVSHAKLLNYTPASYSSAKATVNITFSGVIDPSITIPKNTVFYSDTINNYNYPFITTENITASTTNGTATFNNVVLSQGQPLTYTYTVDLISNPTQYFKIPDSSIDTSTISVLVRSSAVSTDITTFTLSQAHLTLDGSSNVFFLQESLDGYYEIYFGDGILGRQLSTGNIVIISYISTKGDEPNGASKFTLMSSVGNYSSVAINTISTAAGGKIKESIDSIKYNATKVYVSHGRAVTKDDYVNILQRSNTIVPVQAVNVWGGEDLTPPILGKVFIAIKPASGYTLTQTQKQRLLTEVIKPVSVVTVEPTIVDVDYSYLKVKSTILFNKSISILTNDIVQQLVKSTIINFGNTQLNKFNSNFVVSDLVQAIKSADGGIISSDVSISLSKILNPILGGSTNTFTLNFGVPIQKDFVNGVLSTSLFSYVEPTNGVLYNNVRLEGVPLLLNSIDSIIIKQPGSGYTSTPTITILGDGTGATATATIVNGKINTITVTNAGTGYTQAVVSITGGGGGGGATAIALLTGTTINLRSYYYFNGIKTVLQDNVGTLNFNTGTIVISNFMPYDVEDPLGTFIVTIVPDTSLIPSDKDTILTLNPLDQSAIVTTIKAV